MFVEARTRPVLAEVCRRLGYPAARALLLRHHTNAVYAVEDAVVKIAPPGIGTDRLRPVVQVVEWLAARGFPTVRLFPLPTQPLVVHGYAVTIWQRLDPAAHNPVTTPELGTLLAQLHTLPAPPVPLPALQPIEGIRHSILTSPILTAQHRTLLLARLDALAKTWAAMTFPHRPSLIQSDPQTRNALRRSDGTAVLADWDGAAYGPREWDIATVAVHCRRFTPANRDAFKGFIDAYGCNPVTWDGFEDLCQLRELQMIATNARKSMPDTPAAAEVRRRISGLQHSTGQLQAWQIL
jgi:aminoglycoside phosphotransferase (APT) family kinase protein